jgi:predicted glycosyltransferase
MRQLKHSNRFFASVIRDLSRFSFFILLKRIVFLETLNSNKSFHHSMKVWIDISNVPHIHFFKGIISELKKENEVIVTARRLDSMKELLTQEGIEHTMVGEHGGSSDVRKLMRSSQRVLGLTRLFKGGAPDLALFKHSVEAARVSFGLKIPSLCVLDNETAEAQNRLMLPLATKVIAPSCIPLREIRRYGVEKARVVFFDGFCELAHVMNLSSKDVSRTLGLSRKKKTIVLRPEPFMADYCRADPQKTITQYLMDNREVQYVVFPRSEEQRNLFVGENIVVPPHAIDALSLMRQSDLVISAGGTMNREAIALNTPAISTYPEKLLSVTRHLISLGLKKHSLNVRMIRKMQEEFFNTDYDSRPLLKKMDNPVSILLEEVRKF